MPSKDTYFLQRPPSLFCTLNFFLSIVGYPVAMSLLAPFSLNIEVGENIYFTYPFRIFQVLVAIIALFVSRSARAPKFDYRLMLLGLFWVLYLLRAFWDLQVRSTPSPLAWNNKYGIEFQAWCYILLFSFLPLFSTLKGFYLIDFQKVLKWILILGGLSLVTSLFAVSKQSEILTTEEYRVGASKMLNTISYGNIGLTICACAAVRMFALKSNLTQKLCFSLLAFLGIYVMLRAGSRGPLLALFCMVFMWSITRGRYLALGITFSGILLLGIYYFFEEILKFISTIAPVIAHRVEATLWEGDTSGRDSLFSSVWNESLKNPLFGFQLDFLGNSHNIILDGFMMFGFIFGWIVFILVLMGLNSSFKIMKYNKSLTWLALLLVQQLVLGQTSYMFGPDSATQCLLLVGFIFTKNQKTQ